MGSRRARASIALELELVEGENLAERLTRGAVPVDEAIAIARQIAEGLEAAHDKGIVHRDLRPANLKLTKDGTVKIARLPTELVAEDELSAPSAPALPNICGIPIDVPDSRVRQSRLAGRALTSRSRFGLTRRAN